jgi:hypothetical protein
MELQSNAAAGGKYRIVISFGDRAPRTHNFGAFLN